MQINLTKECTSITYSGNERVAYLLDDGVHVKDTIVDTGGYVHGRIHSEESGERSTP